MAFIQDAGDAQESREQARVQSLFDVIDLAGRHTRVDEFLPALSACLRAVIDFDVLGIVLPEDHWKAARLHVVRPSAPDTQTSPQVQIIDVAPLDRNRLSAGAGGGGDYPEIVAALRQLGARSTCILPLATALGPVGLIGFAASREVACDDDVNFMQHVARQVAVAVDNVRHQMAVVARERQLQHERDHLEALLQLTNAVIPIRDLPQLLSVIEPYLARAVGYDDASLFLFEPDGERLGHYVIGRQDSRWTEDLTAQIHPEGEPFVTWLRNRRAVDMEYSKLDWRGREGILKNITASGLKRACFLPLGTSRGTLGFLTLTRRADVPFTSAELERASQLGGQIAIALENARAFDEIAALKNRLANENIYLEQEIRSVQHFGEIVAESPALKRILKQVSTVAPTDTTVLVLGETGTGKELIARALHTASERRSRPLVTVNCATSPAGLLESEWFGHEKGAFTGALSQKVGRFELAHQGTLFLDEIGDVPLELQAKLLRALQEREIERLGSTRTIRVDFRLVAATNRDLEDMTAKREFRSDLYYRLNVFPIRIPPLRERCEDIPPLVHYFVQRFAKQLRRPIESVSRESMEMLCRWPWPGNVRELQNVIERAVIVSQGRTLIVPRTEFDGANRTASTAVTLEEVEREHILRTLDDTGWVIGGPSGAAQRLGLKRTSLASTMRRLGIVRPVPGKSRNPQIPAR